ncbi:MULTISPECIES: hypothetical protein [Myxococcus]|uniref:Uncharacterized protein n=1 Tax=Myxococcus llanfairpwllgwyngyllgogerychwyrndrobwllllantysiliogogogochensis TaxID=2590453 RepID=A0A540X696_9BACT|nr:MULTISPECIES: hypothetical protein [Myxococcus]NTX04786.1 hypothetical protein [Myxococcus sp. CA040A]TQF16749.1 hypothetical protein FJV41_06935 [Myxococcus llanfairpwllgwyngyllgogerychwyrndrobwllllantysiliogogogochensis]
MKTPSSGPRVQPRPLETPATPAPVRNEVKPQAPVVRGDARDVSLFDTGAARKPTVALTTPVAPQGTNVAPGTYPSVADVKAIASIQDPVARNYAITQGYADLSNGLGQMLGKENANWSTFATWASKQAGVSIRNEDMPKFFTDALKGAGDMAGPLKKVDDVLRKVGLPALPLADIAAAGSEALNNVSKSIADGNQFVFNEVGQEFARFIETFQGDTSYDAAKTQKYLDGFGKDKPLLKEAFGHYTKAMFEKDPNKKAELMLLANDQIGLHEQTQLQQHVEKALNAPVKDTFRSILKQSIESGINALPFPANLAGKAALKTGLVDAALNPLVDATASVFRRLATEHMMKLAVPGGALKLGNDLPPPPGMESTLFPPHLRAIENPELRALLGKLDSSSDSLKGTAAKDWSKLDQRMNYIIDLFRTRQSDPHLFDAPFGKTGTTYPLPATQQRAG